jgi:hypothetical protein
MSEMEEHGRVLTEMQDLASRSPGTAAVDDGFRRTRPPEAGPGCEDQW